MRKTVSAIILLLATGLLNTPAKADAPTVDQQGLFFGNGTVTYYWFNGAKTTKIKGEFTLQINADGSGVLERPDYYFGTYTNPTIMNFGAFRGTFNDGMDRGRLEIKSNGSKSSIKMEGRFASISTDIVIEYKASLKRLPPI